MYRKKKNVLKMAIQEYIIVSILFIIGILAGTIFIGNRTSDQKEEICNYVNGYIEQAKGANVGVDSIGEIKNNIGLAIIMWFAGTTIIGIPIVLGIIIWRGFCIGYTLSGLTLVLGIQKSINFTVIALLLQNIILIPAIFTLGVSSIKLYKTIMKDRRKENIKIQMVKHTLCSICMLIAVIASAIIKTQISARLLLQFIT